MRLTQLFLLPILLIGMLVLAGCTQYHPREAPVVSSLIEAQTLPRYLVEKVERDGGQVVHIGETVSIVVPATELFNADSANLQYRGIELLDDIGKLISAHPSQLVRICGFTNNLGSPQRNKALSRRQAQVVSNYLWTQKIDARMAYAIGYGDEMPIASNDDRWGRKLNNRIVIHFRYDTYYNKPIGVVYVHG